MAQVRVTDPESRLLPCKEARGLSRDVTKSRKIFKRARQIQRAISKESEATIAAVTKQTAHASGIVAVIDMEGFVFSRSNLTDGAYAALRSSQPLVFQRGEVISPEPEFLAIARLYETEFEPNLAIMPRLPRLLFFPGRATKPSFIPQSIVDPLTLKIKLFVFRAPSTRSFGTGKSSIDASRHSLPDSLGRAVLLANADCTQRKNAISLTTETQQDNK